MARYSGCGSTAELDGAGKPVTMERFAPEIVLKRPVELELGPDGALYDGGDRKRELPHGESLPR